MGASDLSDAELMQIADISRGGASSLSDDELFKIAGAERSAPGGYEGPSIFSDPVGALTSADWWLTRPSGERISAAQAVAGPSLRVLDGLTLGAGDEIAGYGSALLGGGSVDGEVERARGTQRNFGEASPVADVGLGILSAIKAPLLSSISKKDSLALAGTKLAAEGGAYGGIFGFNEGEGGLGPRLETAVRDAKTGAVIGPAVGLPLVGLSKAASYAAKSADDAASAAVERALGVQYGDKSRGLGRVSFFVDESGNVVPFDAIDDASRVEAPIQRQVEIIKERGFLEGAPNDAGSLKIHLEKQKQSVGTQLRELISKAAAAVGRNEIAPEFQAAREYVASFRDTTSLNLRKVLDSIMEDYKREAGAGFMKLSTFLDKLQKETNFDQATPREVTQLKRLAAFDLRRTAEGVFDSALPELAGEFASANEAYGALSNIGKTINKRVAKQEPSFFGYLAGGSQPAAIITGGLSLPLGFGPAATVAGGTLLSDSVRKAATAKYPLSAARAYEKVAAGANAASDGARAIIPTTGAAAIQSILPRLYKEGSEDEANKAKSKEQRGMRNEAGNPSNPQARLFLPKGQSPTSSEGRLSNSSTLPSVSRKVLSGSASGLAEVPGVPSAQPASIIARAQPKTNSITAAVLDAIRQVESGGRPGLTSKAGARDEYQFMPVTAKAYGVTLGDGDSSDDRAGAAALLQDELDALGSLPLALASYNAGRPRVLKAVKAAGSADWEDVAAFLPKETRDYIPKIIKAMQLART